MSSLYDVIKQTMKEELERDPAYAEPEKRGEVEAEFERVRELYGEFVSRFTDATDTYLMVAVLARDVDAAVKVSNNTAFNLFCWLYGMVKAISPETAAILDTKDPTKFSPTSGAWEDEDGTDN